MTIRVGIVNDLAIAAEVLCKIVQGDPGMTVLWLARDGHEAIARCATALPDIVLMDLIMPQLNGVEATRQIMRATPCPILVVTATVAGNITMVYDAMGAGAMDVTTTPVIGDQRALDSGQVLRRKIHTLCSSVRAALPRSDNGPAATAKRPGAPAPSGRVPQDCRLVLICQFMILLNMPSAPVLSIPRCKGLGLRCAPTMALASTLVEGRAGPSSWPQNMSPIALLSAQSDLAGISVSLSVSCSKWMPPKRELLRACRV